MEIATPYGPLTVKNMSGANPGTVFLSATENSLKFDGCDVLLTGYARRNPGTDALLRITAFQSCQHDRAFVAAALLPAVTAFLETDEALTLMVESERRSRANALQTTIDLAMMDIRALETLLASAKARIGRAQTELGTFQWPVE